MSKFLPMNNGLRSLRIHYNKKQYTTATHCFKRTKIKLIPIFHLFTLYVNWTICEFFYGY